MNYKNAKLITIIFFPIKNPFHNGIWFVVIDKQNVYYDVIQIYISNYLCVKYYFINFIES
jgi:hypothetical protein